MLMMWTLAIQTMRQQALVSRMAWIQVGALQMSWELTGDSMCRVM
jgi:hypothetical protein